jgi:predicted Abi (CAAX) family protease
LNLIRVVPAKGESAVTTSTYLAQLIGPVLLVAAIGLFLNREGYRAMAREFLRSPALLYLSGLLAMAAGVAVVLAHNLWVADWRVLLTVFGWLAAIGGAARIAVPGATKAVGEAMLDKPAWMTIGGAVWLAIGALLCFFGYFG